MDHGEHHSPRPRWTRIVGVPTSHPSPPTTAGDRRPPSSSGRNDDHDHLALYGPGELELHRHALLRRSVERAGLKVWYPGNWMGHSPRAFFRAHCRPPSPPSTDDDGVDGDDDVDVRRVGGGGSRRGGEDEEGDDDDDGGGVEVLLEFRSNARIISAGMTMRNANGGSPAIDDDDDVDDEIQDGDDRPDRSDPGEESEKGEGGGGGGGGGRVGVATAASASRRWEERDSTIQAGEGRPRRRAQLRWTTTAVRGAAAAANRSDGDDGGMAYDHVILAPRRSSRDRRDDGGARCDDPARRSAPSSWEVVLELDAGERRRRRRPPAGGHDGDEGEGGDNDDDDATAGSRGGGVEIDAMDPPPCISLIFPPFATPSLLASSTSVADRNRRLMPHDRRRRLFASSWEWRRSVDDEWTPIDSSWASSDDDDDAPREEERRVDDGGRPNDARDASSTWRFPHQADLCRVSAVRPASRMSSDEDRDGDGGGSGGRRRVVVCDFGREMLGWVRASMPSTADDAPWSSGGAAAADASPPRRRRRRPPPPALTLRVGETMDEAANDDEDHLEQCADVSYALEGGGSENSTTMTNGEDCDGARGGAADDGTAVGTAAAGRRPWRHVWVSRHLLAFRYVRVVVEFPGGDDDDLRPSSSSSDISVACLAHLPLLHRRGTFSCYEDGGGGASHSSGEDTSVVAEERDLDSRIWHAAAYTLQLCTHLNFIVDGECIRKSIHCISSCFFFPKRRASRLPR